MSRIKPVGLGLTGILMLLYGTGFSLTSGLAAEAEPILKYDQLYASIFDSDFVDDQTGWMCGNTGSMRLRPWPGPGIWWPAQAGQWYLLKIPRFAGSGECYSLLVS